ncbi:MAG: tetratricopeptide repeat protein [Thermodesulfovibrionales bacterium]|nr:tetratricopeptide repeat protein [Thermodesulfovibrionales bacterium]
MNKHHSFSNNIFGITLHQHIKLFIVIILFNLLFLICLPTTKTFAAIPINRPDVPKHAEIVSVRGDSEVMFVKTEVWYPAAIYQLLTSGDILKTGTNGKIDVLFINGIQIKIHQRSTLIIREYSKDKRLTELNLKIGEIWSRAKAVPGEFRIVTPSAIGGVRGTDWDLLVDEKGTSYLTVLNGSAEFYNDFGLVRLKDGEQAMAEVGKAPVKVFLVSPKDRVQWTISYQPDMPKVVVFYSHKREQILEILPSVREKVNSDKTDTGSKLLLAGLLYDLKEFDESLKLFDEILEYDKSNTTASIFKGLILLDRGKIDEAMPLLQMGLNSTNPKDRINASIGLAGVYLYKNDLNKVENLLDRLSKDETSPSIGLAMSIYYAYKGDFRGAIGICLDYLKAYPEDERFYTLAGDFYLTIDEPEKTVEAIKKALSINPNSSDAYLILGRYNHLLGKAKESETAFRRSIELNPKNTDAISELGKLLMEKGDFEKSFKKHNEAIDIKPTVSSYHSRRGMLMNWIDEIKSAHRDYKKATEINPSDYQSFDGLGFLALKEGKPDEAIQYFYKASLLEPRFAEPHIFLSIAYYQKEDIGKALEELRLASLLDPKDPIPHMIAYIIYQDTYRPFDAIREATTTLELLPNLKSVNPIDATQKGLTNLGNALLGLGMTEWATSYSEDSYNQYDAGSYYFSAKKYEGNPFIYSSTMSQAFLLDPMSIKYSDRYQDIVQRPQQNLTVNATLGSEDGAFYRKSKVITQGYTRKPFQITYLLDWENYDNKGFRENSYTRSNFLTYAIGLKPDYKNGFFIWGGKKWVTMGDPGTVFQPDKDDTYKDRHTLLSAGYNYRIGNKNNLLFNFFYNAVKSNFDNRQPLGSIGMSDYAISFVNRFGLNQARQFFDKGVYDLGVWNGIQLFATDSTGMLLAEGLQPLSFPSNKVFDTNPVRSSLTRSENLGYQFKHLLTLFDNHDFSYGVEFIPKNRFKTEQILSVTPTGRYMGFYDEIMLPNPEFYAMRDLIYRDSLDGWRYDSKILLAYLNDRWSIVDNLLMEYGITYEWLKSSNTISNDEFRYKKIHPRIGLSWKINNIHTIRTAFQRKLYPGATQSFSPLTTVGLIFDWIQLVPGSIITDYQTSFESRWNDRLFTSINLERRDVKYPHNTVGEKNSTNFIAAAINTILTDRIGAFIRYKYADSEVKDGPYQVKELPLLPRHALGAGLVWVSPSYLKAMLATYYITGQYGNDDNTYKLPNFVTTDLTLTWEALKKHLMVKFDAKNIFNIKYETKQGYPAAGMSAYLTVEYRF